MNVKDDSNIVNDFSKPLVTNIEQIDEITKDVPTGEIYYPINEELASKAKQAISFSDYQTGSATAEYRQYVDKAIEIANNQKDYVDPIYHKRIDNLLNSYAKKLAMNFNKGFEIDCRVPSIMISGSANFPTNKKEKQNQARSKNMEEFKQIQQLLEKIKSTGMGGISADDPDAIHKLKTKLDKLEQLQEKMKSVNAYYRKYKTLDGCPYLSSQEIENLKSYITESWNIGKMPFQSFKLSNNNAQIHRLKDRIKELMIRSETNYVGWEFKNGLVKVNKQKNRLQIFFNEKPDEGTRTELKSNGFRWSPSSKAWQRQLNNNAFHAANYIKSIMPITGELPTDLQQKRQKENSDIYE